MCGAAVEAEAKTCDSCGETMNAGKPGRIRVSLTAELPPICALCGEPATQQLRVRFRQSRENLGKLVRLPVCRAHRFFRPLAFQEPIRQPIMILFGLLLIIAGAKSVAGWPGAIVTGILLVGALVLGVMKALRIRSPYEDSTHIVLSGVAPAFAQACEAMDDREASEVGDALAQMFADGVPEPPQG
jgi:hypothetical protein